MEKGSIRLVLPGNPEIDLVYIEGSVLYYQGSKSNDRQTRLKHIFEVNKCK